ncbi:zinc finger CCHC domain-containing 14 [Brachionus plicatilis]|uniref:Zinc finger CCHC domain-containing 14 n=1 Tax=Brachionus plicatilis TaxID=10195 RepID=A0A3M7SLD5_BRAPC|nr:zinc finger CCHC domain-containing 14 [Brachionus plicatilis]
MQKKFQVYDWFKTLDGAKRIDFLNGMLHLCFPLELRFLGSCIEELARKDYLYLKDAELKANSIQEIQQFKDICDKITRSKMIVTLALLASNNYECARLLFEFLNVDICLTIDKMKLIYMDAKIADEFLLLLTMAANHPAFDFQMKTKMSHLYISTENKLKTEEIINRDSDGDACSCEKSKYKILMEKNILNSYLDNNEFKEKKKTLSEDPVKVDNNNNKNNQGLFDSAENSTMSSKPVFKTSSSSSLSSSNTSLVDTLNNDLELNESKEKNIEHLETKDPNDETFIKSINFEGVRSIKGTNSYQFSIKIHWSDSISSEIHKTYSEICEFNKKLIKLFPNEVSNLKEINSLVSKEDQKEDFVKEMPLVADYCNKLAKLSKEIFKSQLFKSFFIRDLQLTNALTNKESASDASRNEKCDLDIMVEKKSQVSDSKWCEDKNTKKESVDFDQDAESLSNMSKKNVTVSVANVFNQKQKEAFYQKQNYSQLSRSNQHQPKNNLPHSKAYEYNTQKNFLFQNQILNPNLQQLQLQTFQPIASIANAGISSPPSASPIPVHFQSQNINPSGSLNNSRCSSPWMIMPSSPLPINNYQNQVNNTIPNSYQNQKQVGKQIQGNQKEPKQSSMHHHDELLLRYVLDNNNSNSNLPISPNDNQESKTTIKNLKNNVDTKKNNNKSKNHHYQPNQSSSEMFNLQLADQSINNQMNPAISLSPNNPSNSQLVIQNQFSQNPSHHQNYVQSYNNPTNINSSAKIKHSQVPLLLAPVVSKGASNLPIAFGLHQYGQATIFPQNIPIIPGLTQPPTAIPITQVASLPSQDNRVASPSLHGSLSSLSSSFKIYNNSKSNQNKSNENCFTDCLSKKMGKLTATTSEDEDDRDSKKNLINADEIENSKSISDTTDNVTGEIEFDDDEKQYKPKEESKKEQKKQDSVDRSSLKQGCPQAEYNKSISTSYFYNQNKIDSSDELNHTTDTENKTETEIQRNSKSKLNENEQKSLNIDKHVAENYDTGKYSKCYPGSENLSTMTNLNGSSFTHSQPIPISLNNLYYQIPSYGVQEGQNILNGITISTQPVNSHHSQSSSQTQINHSFQQFAHFNSIQSAIPVPIPLGPPFAAPHSQIQALQQGQTQIHQSHHPHPPYLIPFIPPINQSNSQTGKATPTPGSSPTTSQHVTDTNPADECSTNSMNVNNSKHSINLQISQQFPFSVNQNQSTDTNVANFNNMMMTSHSQQLQHHHQNILMMMMMGNGQPGPNFNIGNHPMNNATINNSFSNFPHIQSSHQMQSASTKKSCYNCGSTNHTAYECKEPSLEFSANSNNFKLNYKPNLSANQSHIDQKNINQIENKSLSPRMKHSKFSNKNSNLSNSNQRLENKPNLQN